MQRFCLEIKAHIMWLHILVNVVNDYFIPRFIEGSISSVSLVFIVTLVESVIGCFGGVKTMVERLGDARLSLSKELIDWEVSESNWNDTESDLLTPELIMHVKLKSISLFHWC